MLILPNIMEKIDILGSMLISFLAKNQMRDPCRFPVSNLHARLSQPAVGCSFMRVVLIFPPNSQQASELAHFPKCHTIPI